MTFLIPFLLLIFYLLSVPYLYSRRSQQVHIPTHTHPSPHLASNMAANNPNRRSLDLFNVDQEAVENLDLTFQEALPASGSNVRNSSRNMLYLHPFP